MPRLIQPVKLSLEQYYLECCKNCDLRVPDLPYQRIVLIGDSEVKVKTSYHEQCASCYARFLHPLYKKGKQFWIV